MDIPPIIIIIGDEDITRDVNDPFIEPGVSATDALGESVTVETTGTVDTDTLGNYILTYTATDDYGNTSTASRTVSIVDNTAPNISLNDGQHTETLQLNEQYVEDVLLQLIIMTKILMFLLQTI